MRRVIQILQNRRNRQLQKWVLTADLREKLADYAENAANSVVQFDAVAVVVRSFLSHLHHVLDVKVRRVDRIK